MNSLRLDLSLRQNDDTLEATYRDEGLSVGADHMVSETILCHAHALTASSLTHLE